MPRTTRQRKETSRAAVIPDFVYNCLKVVNERLPFGDSTSLGVYRQRQSHPFEWDLKLEMLKDFRESEAPANDEQASEWRRLKIATDHAKFNVMSQHNQILTDHETDPPWFDETALWLLKSGRTRDLYRCRFCNFWNLATDDRRVDCLKPGCKAARDSQHVANHRQRTRRKSLRAK